MHPLSQQLSTSSAATGDLLMAKDGSAAHQNVSGQNALIRRIDVHGSFQQFFEAASKGTAATPSANINPAENVKEESVPDDLLDDPADAPADKPSKHPVVLQSDDGSQPPGTADNSEVRVAPSQKISDTRWIDAMTKADSIVLTQPSDATIEMPAGQPKLAEIDPAQRRIQDTVFFRPEPSHTAQNFPSNSLLSREDVYGRGAGVNKQTVPTLSMLHQPLTQRHKTEGAVAAMSSHTTVSDPSKLANGPRADHEPHRAAADRVTSIDVAHNQTRISEERLPRRSAPATALDPLTTPRPNDVPALDSKTLHHQPGINADMLQRQKPLTSRPNQTDGNLNQAARATGPLPQSMPMAKAERSAPVSPTTLPLEQQVRHKTSQMFFATHNVSAPPSNHLQEQIIYEQNPRNRKLAADITHAPDRPPMPPLRTEPQKPMQGTTSMAGQMQQTSSQNSTFATSKTESLNTLFTGVLPSPTVPHNTLPTRAELPIHIARQLVEVAQHLPARPVEITLSPEELGRVRLSVAPSEHGIIVSLLTERPETMDLMRRHIDQLAQEFHDLGYDDIAFSFSSSEQKTSQDDDNTPGENKAQNRSTGDHDNDVETTQIHLSTGTATGLDLRL